MGTKNDYLPTKCWLEDDGSIHRAFFEYEECTYDSPRDWDNLGVIVNASSYGITGHNDVETNDIEDWLISETGINEDWYYANRKRYGGIEGLINKFIKEKCVAFQYISIYEHSGVSISCGKAYGWDYSNVGFIYAPKDSQEVKDYLKGHTLKETEEWAEGVIKGEINVLDDWAEGNVYVAIHEKFDEELCGWEFVDSLGDIYLTSDTFERETNSALEEIKYNFSGKYELFDEDVMNNAIKNNTVDVLKGQQLFDFMEIA